MTELLKPLVNHQLSRSQVLQQASTARHATMLLAAVDCLVNKGELREELLPFLWRDSKLAPEDYEAVLSMFRASGILFVAEASQHGRRWIMPMRLPLERPAAVPASLLEAHEAAISLHLDVGNVVPPGLMERLMGLGLGLGKFDKMWRCGALLRCANGGWVLMERLVESPHVVLEVGGRLGTEAALEELLERTQSLFDSISRDFEGLRVRELSKTRQPSVCQPRRASSPVIGRPTLPRANSPNAPSAAEAVDDRFVAPFFVFGQPTNAISGLHVLLGVTKKRLRLLLAEEEEAIVHEVRERGSTQRDAHGFCDADWLRYVYEEAAVEAPLEEGMPSDVLDRGHAGMRLDDFVNHPLARAAQLTRAEVLALRYAPPQSDHTCVRLLGRRRYSFCLCTLSAPLVRSLYTTSMYRSINKPLRDGCSESRPHPLPSLVANLSHALSSLRVHGATGSSGGSILWRGVRDFDLSDEFKERGVRALASNTAFSSPYCFLFKAHSKSFVVLCQGTELSPMSTTGSQAVAAEYATRNNAQHSLLLRFHASTFMDSGCDISFLSGEFPSPLLPVHPSSAAFIFAPCVSSRAAFPDEQEFLYPPGTYLSVKEGSTWSRETVQLTRQTSSGVELGRVADVTILDVEPALPTL